MEKRRRSEIQEPAELPPSPTAADCLVLPSTHDHPATLSEPPPSSPSAIEPPRPAIEPPRPAIEPPPRPAKPQGPPPKPSSETVHILKACAKAAETKLPTDLPPGVEMLLKCNLGFPIVPLKIGNVMASAYFARGETTPVFDLVHLSNSVRHGEYMPKHGTNKGFPAVLFKMPIVEGKPSTTFTIFAKGVVNINGALRSADHAYKAVKRILLLLRHFHHDLTLTSWNITNVYATVQMPIQIRLDQLSGLAYEIQKAKLEEDHPLVQLVPQLFISYSPEVFSGAKIWFEPRKDSWSKRGRNKGRYASLFSTGYIVLTGNKSVAAAWDAYLTILRILGCCPYMWRLTPPKPPVAAKTKKSKKK